MFEFLGSIFTFIFTFIAIFLLGILVWGIALFWAMRRKLRQFRKETEGTANRRKSNSSARPNGNGKKNTTVVSTDFEQPLYDDANAEYVDYKEVK